MSEKARDRSSIAPDVVAFVVVAIGAAALIAWRVALAVHVGPGWDTFAFLSNAAEFAGKGYGYTELHRPPLLSLLTALAFRWGAPIHESVIQWIDGGLSFSGVIAFYLLARRRFAPPLAAVSALGLLAVQPLWQYLGVGYTDFPSVALSIWFVLAMIWATEKSPWYYGIAALLFLAAVLTRYTALLIVFPGLLWFALRAPLFRHAKAVAASLVLAVAAYLPMGRFYARRFGDGLFPFVLALSVSEAVTAPSGEGAVSAAGPYYLARMASFLSGERLQVLGWLALAGTLAGLALGVVAHVTSARPTPRRLALGALGLGAAVVGQLVGGLFVRQFTLPLAVFMVWRALAPTEGDTSRVTSESALDATMLLLFLTYFDFHGHQAIQVPRYIITMAPAILYFVALGWWQAVADIGRTLAPRHGGSARPAWPTQTAAAMGLGLILAFTLVATVTASPSKPDPLVRGARQSALWLSEHVGARDLRAHPLYSDLWPLTAWYARTPARPMPFFKDERAFEHELMKGEARYFVTIRSRRFDDFETTTTAGPVTVLERSRPASRVLPRVAYLGKAWDNYLETVTDYSFFLEGDSGRYGWEGTAFLDQLSTEQLSEYDAVAVYGVRWRDRARGEAALATYLRQGGSVVIDASRNIGELPYELGDTVIFDTVVKRGLVPRRSRIAVAPSFAEAHPDIGTIGETPFENENGAGWYGAEYSELPGTAPLEVLASVNGKPAVAVRRVGKGRVYWIGYNMVWHAFLTENRSESRLMRAVFDDAITHSRLARVPDGDR